MQLIVVGGIDIHVRDDDQFYRLYRPPPNMPMQCDLLNPGDFEWFVAYQGSRASAPPSAGG